MLRICFMVPTWLEGLSQVSSRLGAWARWACIIDWHHMAAVLNEQFWILYLLTKFSMNLPGIQLAIWSGTDIVCFVVDMASPMVACGSPP